MSYKVIDAIIPATTTDSTAVTVPGRLVGVSIDMGAAAMNATVQLLTPFGWADIIVGASRMGIDNSSAGRFIAVNFDALVGPIAYRIVTSATTASNRAVQFYYEDMPYFR